MEYRGEAIDFNASNGNITRADEQKPTFTNNVPQFHVWGYHINGASSSVKMNDVLVEKTSEGVWEYSPKQYWPKEGVIDFVAINPTATEVTAGEYVDHRVAGQNVVKLEHDGFTTGENRKVTVTAQRKDATMNYNSYLPDLIYSVSEDQSRQSTAVGMHFRHAMAQVKLRVKNENHDFTLEFKPNAAVEIHNIKSKGTFTLPNKTTIPDTDDSNTYGEWSFDANDYATFDVFTGANPYVVGMTEENRDGYISSGNFLKDGRLATLLPCQVPGWVPENGPASEQKGAYFVLYCRVSYQRGTMAQRYYLIGDKDEANNIDRYDPIYVPVTINWQPGYIYSYCFAFGKGVGYIETGEPSTVPLTFSLDVTPYTNGGTITTPL